MCAMPCTTKGCLISIASLEFQFRIAEISLLKLNIDRKIYQLVEKGGGTDLFCQNIFSDDLFNANLIDIFNDFSLI